MRKAMQTLAARGLGASSLAGQAVIQAAMEAALPIAQIDTANKQQMAILKAEQRAKFLQQDFDQDFQRKVLNAAKVSEIANMNFNADQQIADSHI
jgi:L-fucose mutarotase/ribose pyranase (RbsD/FucU family)